MLIEQLLESVRRVKYVEVIRTLKLSNRRADPNDDLFDPLKAAILCQRRRNIQDVKSNMVFGHFLNQQLRRGMSCSENNFRYVSVSCCKAFYDR